MNMSPNKESKGDFPIISEFNTRDPINSFLSVAKNVVVSPREFFARMPAEEGLKNPFIFLAFCLFVSTLFFANIIGANFSIFVRLFTFLLLWAFLWSGLLYAAVVNFFKGKGTFQGTFRIVAYTGVTHLVSWIPVLGIIASFYGFYLVIVGLAQVHRIDTGKAALSLVSTIGVFFLIATLLVIFIGTENFTG